MFSCRQLLFFEAVLLPAGSCFFFEAVLLPAVLKKVVFLGFQTTR